MKGYKGRTGENAARDLTIGEVIINRKREPSKNWYYDIQFLNTTSGENLHLDFYTADDDLRTLRDTWRVTAINNAGDKYRQFTCEGHITSQGDQQRITLVVNNTTLPVGHFDNAHPITCNWTLFDAIPNLAHQLKASGEQISLAILEDLEKNPHTCAYWLYGRLDIATRQKNTKTLRLFRLWRGNATLVLVAGSTRTGHDRIDHIPNLRTIGKRGMSDRPNILFINTDQHTWDVISAYGNTHVKTPHIDRLHNNGISFMRSYSSDPVCAPARASWMTGRFTSEAGTPFNGGYLHEDIPDLGQVLQQSDYRAIHCGKWHVDGRNVYDSFDVLYYGQQRIGAGGGEYYDAAMTHAVVDFLTDYDKADPFYLQVWYVNPHDICEYGHNFETKKCPMPCAGACSAKRTYPLYLRTLTTTRAKPFYTAYAGA